MTGLVQTSSEETRPRSSSALIAFCPWIWARIQADGAQPSLADVFIYFCYTVFITLHVCVIIFMASRFSWLLVLGLYKEDYLQIFKCVSFCLHSICSKWDGWDPVKRFNHTSWVRNRCVIENFDGVCVLSRCFLGFSVGVEAFVIGLSQISSFFLFLFT